MKLDGQVAIVTGAGRGIGSTIAQTLAREGAKVALVSRTRKQLENVRKEIEQAGGTAMVIPADVVDSGAVNGMVRKVLDTWKRIDILVNNAGIFSTPGPLWETEPSGWWNDVTVNLLGLYTCSHFVLPVMLEQRSGVVINMVGGGAPGPFPNATSYGSSKAAVGRLSDTMALELEGTGVMVFTTGPGLVRTDMTENLVKKSGDANWFPNIKEGLETGRDKDPSECAELILKLITRRDAKLQGRFLIVGGTADAIERADEVAEKDLFVLRIGMESPGESLHRALKAPREGSGQCKGKRIVVTGAGRGIGRSIAKALAREGAAVVVVARTAREVEEVVQEISVAGGEALACPADVTQEGEVKAMIAKAIGQFGGIDALFNNAGVFGPVGNISEVAPAEWWDAVSTNLLGTYLCCRYAVPHMLESGRGMIVNMLGGGAVRPKEMTSAYGASKAGVARMTDTLAVELRDTNIRVLAMGPGLVKTRMTETILKGEHADEVFADMKERFAQGLDCDPAETGELAVKMLTHPDKRLDGRLISVGFNEGVLDVPSVVEGTNQFLLRLKTT